MAHVKEKEQGEGEEAQRKLSMNGRRINTQGFGISVDIVWEFIVLQSNENSSV